MDDSPGRRTIVQLVSNPRIGGAEAVLDGAPLDVFVGRRVARSGRDLYDAIAADAPGAARSGPP